MEDHEDISEFDTVSTINGSIPKHLEDSRLTSSIME